VPGIVHLASVFGDKCSTSLPALHDAFSDQGSHRFLNSAEAEWRCLGKHNFRRQFFPRLPVPIFDGRAQRFAQLSVFRKACDVSFTVLGKKISDLKRFLQAKKVLPAGMGGRATFPVKIARNETTSLYFSHNVIVRSSRNDNLRQATH
jgi:hypothetical protein